jgi:hypothetical protein
MPMNTTGFVTTAVSVLEPKGWACPRCNRIWSPTVEECRPCNPGSVAFKTYPGTTTNPPFQNS